jgi:hypothetical protein
LFPEPGHPFEILNPCTDFAFKKAFYNSIVLIDFLNHILDYRTDNQIVELSYMDKEFPSLSPIGREFRVDIVCKTKNDRYSLIEMHNDFSADYADKVYVEFARFLSGIDVERIHDLSVQDHKKFRIGQTEVRAQDFWQKIEEVCTLVISNKKFNPETMKKKYTDETLAEPDIINTYEMLNKNHPQRHLGNLDAKVVLVMLANFNKTAEELETDTDRWLFALKDDNMASGKSRIHPFKVVSDISKAASENEGLRQFYAELHTKNMGKDFLFEYDKQMQALYDHDACVFAEGKLDGILGVAKACKTQGMEISAIVTVTGLSAEVIETL